MPTTNRPPRRRWHPERREQQQIVLVLEHIGAKVYKIGTTRKKTDHPGTMMSRGLPDLLAFLPYEHGEQRRGERLLVVEVKALKGRSSDAQVLFADHCKAAGLAYVVGGLAAVVAWCLAEGYLEGRINDWRIPRRRATWAPDLDRQLESLKAVQSAFAQAFKR